MPGRAQHQLIFTILSTAGVSALLVASSKLFFGNTLSTLSALGIGVLLVGGWLAWRISLVPAGLPCSGPLRSRGPQLRTRPRLLSGLEIPILLSLGGVLLSLAASPAPRVGLEHAAWLVFGAVLFYFLLDVLAFPAARAAAITGLLVVSGFTLLMALLETYVWYLAWWAQVGSAAMPPIPYRFVGVLNHPNILMAFANLCAPLALVIFVSPGQSRAAKIGSAFWLVMYALALPFSSSRGAWMGLAAGLGVLIVLWLADGQRWKAAAALLRRRWLVCVGALLVLLPAGGFAALRFYHLFAGQNPTHGSGVSLNREMMWNGALDLWRASPWFGVGPGRVGLEFLRTLQTYPASFWPWNAHSTPLQVLAEFGLVGAVPFALLCAAGTVLLVRAARQASVDVAPAQRPLVWAMLSGLATAAVQGMFEDYTFWPLLLAVIAFETAYVLTAGQPLLRFRHISTGALAVPAALALLVGAYQVWSAAPANRAASPNTDPAAAAHLAEESIRRDPWMPVYRIQAGMSWAMVWKETGSAQALRQARERLGQGATLEPNNAMVWANLAVLDWQSGSSEDAIAHIRQAAALGPDEPSFPLNYAWFLEMSGRSTEAAAQYRRALELAPATASHPFWQATSLRRDVLKAYMPFPAQAYWQKAHEQLAAGQIALARQSLALSQANSESPAAVAASWALYENVAGDPAAARQRMEALQKELDARYWNASDALKQFYMVYGRGGSSTAAAPGYLQLRENAGQFGALEALDGLQRGGATGVADGATGVAGDCAAAARTWETLQRELRAGEWPRGGYPPAPACP